MTSQDTYVQLFMLLVLLCYYKRLPECIKQKVYVNGILIMPTNLVHEELISISFETLFDGYYNYEKFELFVNFN